MRVNLKALKANLISLPPPLSRRRSLLFSESNLIYCQFTCVAGRNLTRLFKPILFGKHISTLLKKEKMMVLRSSLSPRQQQLHLNRMLSNSFVLTVEVLGLCFHLPLSIVGCLNDHYDSIYLYFVIFRDYLQPYSKFHHCFQYI